jgi:hypothetical protein
VRLGLEHVVVGGARHAGELDAVRAFAEGREAALALSRTTGRLRSPGDGHDTRRLR